MISTKRIIVCLLIGVYFFGKNTIVQAQNEPTLYWVDHKKMEISQYDIMNKSNQIFRGTPGEISTINDIALDTLSEKMYWATSYDIRSYDVKTQKFKFVAAFSVKIENNNFIAIDHANGKLYLSNDYQKIIRQVDLQTGSIKKILTSDDGLEAPLGIAARDNMLFWADGKSIMKMDLSNKKIETLTTVSEDPRDLEMDPSGQWLYWNANTSDKTIRRIKIDGTGMEDVVTPDNNCTSLCFDAKNNKFIYTTFKGALYRSNYDGSNETAVIEPGSSIVVRYGLTYDAYLDKYFWIDDYSDDSSRMVEYDTENKSKTMFSESSRPTDVALDAYDQKLFWMDPEITSIHVVDLKADTAGIIHYGFGSSYDGSLEIDTSANKIFFSNGSRVKSMNYDGTEIDTVGPVNGGIISGLAIDPEHQEVYYTDNFSYGNLEKAKYDGSSYKVLKSMSLNDPRGLSYDPVNHYLYWAEGTDASSTKIVKADTMGNIMQDVLTNADDGLENPRDLALDPLNEQIYWSDKDAQSISRANYDGSEKVTLLSNGLYEPTKLALFVGQKITAIAPVADNPDHIKLKQNYPNPFNPTTTIPFQLNQAQRVTVTIYDMLGRQVEKLVDHHKYQAGSHRIQFDASKLSSGVYIYRLETGKKSYQHALTLIK